ncbi:MAG: hypothetical protein LAQ69_30595 [Acidobacteriia bacterium]|nr:hypothetical protein [Terriglobia bacterium]
MDTTTVYPSIDRFPMSFDVLRRSYEGFAPRFEGHRGTIEDHLREIMEQARTPEQVEDALNTPDARGWFRQRVFYRSCTAFYRSFALMGAFLTLERDAFKTWAQVTAYYSRFFFLQAFLNLLQATYVYPGRGYALLYYDGTRLRYKESRTLPPMMRNAGSHEQWWYLMEAVKHPVDYPIEHMEMIISRLVFNPNKRNTENYSFEYLEGFPELDWFDKGAQQLLSHFHPYARTDRDITNLDRYFEGSNPEDCDPGDFYTDDGAVLWTYLAAYLQLVKHLGFTQEFLATPTIAALGELHLGTRMPTVLEGIVRATADILADNFDLDNFLDGRAQHPERPSSFWPPT